MLGYRKRGDKGYKRDIKGIIRRIWRLGRVEGKGMMIKELNGKG